MQFLKQAPVRFLVAGMGDAYATYYEGRACMRSSALNYNKAASTRAKVVTPALENIIEANVLLSGIGFESVGLAAAHSIHGGLTELPETHGAMHGEKVAIGTLVQLIMENAPMKEMVQTLNYYKMTGLPTKLSDIGISEATEEKL